MTASTTDTSTSTKNGQLGSTRTQQQSTSPDLHEEDTTTSTPSDPLLYDRGSSSEKKSTAASAQILQKYTRNPTASQVGTVPKQPIPKVRPQHHSVNRIAGAYHSAQKWISRQVWWPLEVGCWLLSLAFLFAIVAFLAVFDGNTVPQWRFGITINTLVSVFATINVLLLSIIISAAIGQIKWIWFRNQARALVDFDIINEASKGPTGSFILLLRWRGGILAIIGACLTILILAIGPFIQQIIAFENRPVAELTASIPIAQNYDPQNNVQQTTLAIDMKAAVLDGALTTSVVEYTNIPSCATGNCTWTNYQSLAVCSACAEVNGTELGKLLNLNLTDIALLEALGYMTVAPFWNPLPLNDAINAGYTEQPTPTLAFEDHGILIADVFIGAMSKTFECILDFCIIRYNASVENGNFMETEISRTHQRGPTSMIDSYNDAGDGTANEFPVLNFPEDANAGSHYIVPDDIYYLSQYINSTFAGNVTTAPDNGANAESSLTISSDVVEAFYTMMYVDGQPTPDIIFNNTAQSLTKVIRANAHVSEGSKATLAMGNTLHNETFISVRWPWIILPVTVQLFALAFLVVIIYLTKRAKLEAYKDGVLPVLFQAIDEESRRNLGRLTLLSDMDEVAETTEMMLLDRPSAGWSLSTLVNESSAKA